MNSRMVISQATVERFRETLATDFENRILSHLRRCFPRECAAFDEQALASLIQYGSKRASHYGFSTERDVCMYVDLALLFGRDFDHDANLTWAETILLDPDREDPSERARDLFEQGLASYG